MRSFLGEALILAASSVGGLAHAQEDWQRFHLGVALGESHLNRSLSEASETLAQIWGDMSIDDDTRAWKAAAGLRPLRVVGAEIQYVDFGEGKRSRDRRGGGRSPPDRAVDMHATATAWVVSAVLYIPERASKVDVYGKVGVAELDESLEAHHVSYLRCAYPPTTPPCEPPEVKSDVRHSSWNPYCGIGARFKVARAVGVRVEYEAMDRDDGDDTTMVSVGVAWER
jgi:hypothetical protein